MQVLQQSHRLVQRLSTQGNWPQLLLMSSFLCNSTVEVLQLCDLHLIETPLTDFGGNGFGIGDAMI